MNTLNKKTGIKGRIIRVLLFSFLGMILAVVQGIFILLIWIHIGTNKNSRAAQAVFHKDKIESLLMVIDSDQFTLKEKNRAIETLGFLRDERAIEKLESLVTHEKCDHQRKICQYNLTKSILKIKGEYSAFKSLRNKNLIDMSQF